MFGSLKCAAKLNEAFGFVLKNVEDLSCRYYWPHKKFTLLERSQLVAFTEDLTKVKKVLGNTDVVLNRLQESEPTENGFFTI